MSTLFPFWVHPSKIVCLPSTNVTGCHPYPRRRSPEFSGSPNFDRSVSMTRSDRLSWGHSGVQEGALEIGVAGRGGWTRFCFCYFFFSFFKYHTIRMSRVWEGVFVCLRVSACVHACRACVPCLRACARACVPARVCVCVCVCCVCVCVCVVLF